VVSARPLLAFPAALASAGLAGLVLTDRFGWAGLVVGVVLGLVAGTVATMWSEA
jgi:hypothetical protein